MNSKLTDTEREKKNLIIRAVRILIKEGPIKFSSKCRKYLAYKFRKDELKKVFSENRPFKRLLQRKTLQKIKIFLSNKDNTIVFPRYKKPKISIIIITFNKVFYTFRCLESVKAFADVPYEIILVDNGSKDETIQILSRLKNMKIIKNPENIGFVRACNQASKIAHGKFLLFLNNDTEILPNCFSNLVTTIEGNKKCGAVGARIIFPNGRLQCAGAILMSDGTTISYGCADSPLKPEYNYVREVDYCSGACLLIRSELFHKFGGFDEIYSPGYYEECDFCMKLKKNGYAVLYQPAANIVHYLGGSSESSAALNSLVMKNRAKFIKKWGII